MRSESIHALLGQLLNYSMAGLLAFFVVLTVFRFVTSIRLPGGMRKLFRKRREPIFIRVYRPK